MIGELVRFVRVIEQRDILCSQNVDLRKCVGLIVGMHIDPICRSWTIRTGADCVFLRSKNTYNIC